MAGVATASVHELARDDTHTARATLYLRILYSSAAWDEFGVAAHSGPLPTLTRALFESLDLELLLAEQRARCRQLRRQLIREVPLLPRILGADQLTQRVSSFVDSDAFWIGKGRSLAESFCVHAIDHVEHVDRRDVLEREALQLVGMFAGLGHGPSAPSPWPQGPQLAIPGALACESMFSDHQLVELMPALQQTNEPLGALGERFQRKSLIVVAVLSNGEVKALAVEV